MVISRSTEYALRIAAFLALSNNNSNFNSQQVSKSTNVPSHYCSKILRKLVKAKILSAVRGKGGGFFLNKNPASVNFADIFKAIDVDLNLKRCVFGLEKCDTKTPCPLHYRWKEFNEQFCSWAEKTTLKNIINDVDTKILLKRYRFLNSTFTGGS